MWAPGNSFSTIGRSVAAPSTSVSARARIEHAVGENVAAIQIGAELRLVDRHEGDIDVARHSLDGGNPIARVGRLDLFFAGDQRDRFRAGAGHDLVVDLA